MRNYDVIVAAACAERLSYGKVWYPSHRISIRGIWNKHFRNDKTCRKRAAASLRNGEKPLKCDTRCRLEIVLEDLRNKTSLRSGRIWA